MTVHSADVAILGGGFAAWVCACALRDRGVAVAVLHRRQAAAGPAVGEYLPPEGISAIAALGLGDILDAPAHRACAGVLSAWGDARPVRQDTLMHPGSRALNLDRAVLVRDLAARGRSRGVGTVSCSGVPALGGRPGAWVVDLATPAGAAQVRARFLVDATGRSAALARARGARVLRQDGLVGLAAVHAPAPVDDSALRIESLPDGWCYAAPLSGDRLAAVFLTDAVGLPAGQSARTALAAERLRHSRLIGPHLGSARPAFRVVPAWSQWTEPGAGPGWIAIGDAAMAFDPLASAGLTKALEDVRRVADTLASGRQADPDRLAAERAARFAGYRRGLATAYAAERRHDGPFWARRRAPAETPVQDAAARLKSTGEAGA